MVKVKFKRDHVDHIEGDEAEVTQERANYLERTGAIHSDRVKEEKQPYINKMQKGKRKTKAK